MVKQLFTPLKYHSQSFFYLEITSKYVCVVLKIISCYMLYYMGSNTKNVIIFILSQGVYILKLIIVIKAKN